MPPQNRLENLVERIEAAEQISDDDREVLLAFEHELALRRTERTDSRREKLLRHATIMAEEVGGLADALEDRDAAERIVRWIHDTYDNEESNSDYRVALKAVGRYATDVEGDDPPPTLSWFNSGTSSNYDTTPDPSKMYTWDEHVLPMLDACTNARDRAVIAMQWDVGLRSGELHAPDTDTYVSPSDITDSPFGLQVTVNGKQGRRSPTLIPSVPYVNQWLAAHPGGSNSDAPFVSKLSKPEAVSKNMFLKIFRQAAEKADMEPPSKPTPTRFRKSSASYLASQNVSQPHLENRYGWVRGSDHAGRYIAVFGQATQRAVARAHGLDVQDEDDEPTGPVTCVRCGSQTPRAKDFCIECGQALNIEAKQLVDEIRDGIDERLISDDVSADARADMVSIRNTIERKPAMMDTEDLHQLASSLGLSD